jgi:hypothetical protein
MAEQPLNEHALRAASTYGAAADHYGLPPLSFWDRFGAATVSRLRLVAGASVLDLCCGAGASAIRSAHAVGPGGAVLGIDVALAGLLSRAEVPGPAVVTAAGQHQLGHPDRFWDIVLGTGYRATVDALSQEQRDRVRGWLLSELRSRAVTTVRTDVVFGTARRPA